MSTPRPQLTRPGFGALLALVTLDLLGFGMVVPLLPLYGRRFALSGAEIGWLLASYSLMQLIFAPIWGALSDRIGRRPVLLLSLCGQCISLLSLALAQTFFGLLFSRTLAGLFAANLAVAHAYIADVTEPRERPRRMGMLGAAFGLGFVGGPALAGELTAISPAAPAFAAALLTSLNIVAAFVWLPESVRFARATKGAAQESHSLASQWRARIGALRELPALWEPLILVFGQILGFAAMELTLTLFVTQTFGLDARASGRLLAYVGLVLIAVQGGLVGPAVRRFGAASLVRGGLAVMALGMALLALSDRIGLGAVFVALGLLALGQGLVSPSLSSLVATHSGAGRYGLGLGLSQSASALARVLGPLVSGVAIDLGGVTLPLWLGATWLLLLTLGATLRHARSPKLPATHSPQEPSRQAPPNEPRGAMRDAI